MILSGPRPPAADHQATPLTHAFGQTRLVRGSRRLRYRGTDRNRLWLGHRVAAVNLKRLVNLGLTHGPDGWATA